MAVNTRIDHDINSPPQGQPLHYADAAGEPLLSGARPSRRDLLAPGTLLKPGPIGRIVRALLGLSVLNFVYAAIVYRGEVLGTTAPDNYSWYLNIAIGLWVTSLVVNIGLSRRWGYRPLFVVLALIGGAIALDVALYGTFWAAPLGIVLLAWLIPLYAYLGGSLILASILATPGCEMRAVPDLWGRFTGRSHIEHACPGPLDDLDVWEQRRSSGGTGDVIDAGDASC